MKRTRNDVTGDWKMTDSAESRS